MIVNSPRAKAGFSLVELLVVIMILGLLAALLVPRLLGQRRQAQYADAKTSLREALGAVRAYNLANDQSYAGLCVHEPSRCASKTSLRQLEGLFSAYEPADNATPGPNADPRAIWMGNGVSGQDPDGQTIVLCSLSKADRTFCLKDEDGRTRYSETAVSDVQTLARDDGAFSDTPWNGTDSVTAASGAYSYLGQAGSAAGVFAGQASFSVPVSRDVAAGSTVIIAAGWRQHDNSPLVSSISDTNGNDWTIYRQSSRHATGACGLYGSRLSEGLRAGDTVTLTFTVAGISNAARVSSMHAFSGVGDLEDVNSIGGLSATATNPSQPIALTTSGPGRLIFANWSVSSNPSSHSHSAAGMRPLTGAQQTVGSVNDGRTSHPYWKHQVPAGPVTVTGTTSGPAGTVNCSIAAAFAPAG